MKSNNILFAIFGVFTMILWIVQGQPIKSAEFRADNLPSKDKAFQLQVAESSECNPRVTVCADQ